LRLLRFFAADVPISARRASVLKLAAIKRQAMRRQGLLEAGGTNAMEQDAPSTKSKVSAGAGMIVRDISPPVGTPVMRFAEPPLQRWQTLYSSSFSSVLPLPAGPVEHETMNLIAPDKAARRRYTNHPSLHPVIRSKNHAIFVPASPSLSRAHSRCMVLRLLRFFAADVPISARRASLLKLVVIKRQAMRRQGLLESGGQTQWSKMLHLRKVKCLLGPE
jgi:hypothetical protein